ncbi:MAG: aminoacyl-tRNA hydrolase [Psittacicella sp.]
MSKIKLIVGLGNPGKDYVRTRHNIGQEILEEVGKDFNFSFSLEKKFFGEVAKGNLFFENIWGLIPITFMNASGKSVSFFCKFYDIKPNEILVIHDELDIKVGDIRLKYAGGHGGHNGLKDIIKAIGSNEFYRLRVGVNHPGSRDLVINHVLGRFSKKEEEIIFSELNLIEKTLEIMLKESPEAAMQFINTKKK